MKQFIFFIVLFFFAFTNLIGQKTTSDQETDTWGDYYFINGNYTKAIRFFENTSKELRIEQQRNLAQAYLATLQEVKAKVAYGPVANSVEASVEDYYRYADLLMEEQRLANEYRTKAYKLPWPTPALFEQDSLLYKQRFGASIYSISGVKGNTANNEFGLIFMDKNPNGKVFYLSDQEKTKEQKRALKRVKSDLPIYNFYQATYTASPSSLVPGNPLPNTLNTFFQEGPGSYDSTSDRFYFTRSDNKYDKKKKVHLNVYSIKKTEISQSKIALPLPFNMEGYSTLHPAISPNGKRLFFASDRPGGFGGMDLYYVNIENNRFSDPINLGPDINTEGDEVFPYAYSEKQLFFSSNGREGIGNLDLFLAEHVIEKRWETFILGKDINTKEDDFSFGIKADLSMGYFASDREGGQGADDLYTFPFTPEISGLTDHYVYVPSDTLIVANSGVLKNDLKMLNDKDPLQRLLEKEAIPTIPPKHGSIFLNRNGSFLYKNNQPLTQKDSFAYRLQTVKGYSDNIWVQLERAAVDSGELKQELAEAFASIFYNLDKSNILEEYLDRVNKVVEVMRKNPSLEIEVSSYTDCRGSARYNLSLSQRRTKAIIDYVQARIEKPERIFGKGYGETAANKTGWKDYQLVAGSYGEQKNIDRLITLLNQSGIQAEKDSQGRLTRVIVAQSDHFENLKAIQEQLAQQSIKTWITESSCYQLSEEEHQANRRTDFKVIRL